MPFADFDSEILLPSAATPYERCPYPSKSIKWAYIMRVCVWVWLGAHVGEQPCGKNYYSTLPRRVSEKTEVFPSLASGENMNPNEYEDMELWDGKIYSSRLEELL